MKNNIKGKPFIFLLGLILLYQVKTFSQTTTIRGFVDIGASLEDDKTSFEFGEYDLFITSELSDHISFLGETVFEYDEEEEQFEVGVERVIVNYNYKGNHSILIGKHHTPINYWNDSYHHGRVFFPTVSRPLLFAAHIIPLHTLGVALQGLNLGRLRFGYNVMVGNGLGSGEFKDNDKYKSLTAAFHIIPVDNMKIGVSFYNDIISEGALLYGTLIDQKINQHLYTASFAYFGSKFEMLVEGTSLNNNSDESNTTAFAGYAYAGVRFYQKWVPYLRVDYLDFDEEKSYLPNNDMNSFIGGLRFEMNYLTVFKLEYQYADYDYLGTNNKLTFQVAIGF